MQQSNQPPKFLLPIAQNDPSKATIPPTSPDDTRASQSLGFPPRTGLPPEAGGVPPQLPDFNGLMNQLSGPIRWALLGGRFAYDAAFATDALIGGYPKGASLPAADGFGDWLSSTDDNTANPDTVGTGWVPGYQYGATALTGQTGGNVTLTPAQAAKRVITVAGTLTGNLVLIVPAWRYDWTFYNNTSGAFSVSVRTAAGSAAAVPQNGAPTPVLCDGTNCSLSAPNIGPATSATQAATVAQTVGRLLRTSVYTKQGAVQSVSVNGQPGTTVGGNTFSPMPATVSVRVRVLGAGGAGGGAPATTASTFSAGGGGAAGSYAESWLAAPSGAVAITVGSSGVSAVGGNGGAGGDSSYGSTVTASGGGGGGAGQLFTGGAVVRGGSGFTGVGNIFQGQGAPGAPAVVFGNTLFVSGAGGASLFGGGGNSIASTAGDGFPAQTYGGGGGGSGAQFSVSATRGGEGGYGLVIVEEYA